MKQLFQIIEKEKEKKEKKLLTILEGEHAGEKAFFAEKELLWQGSGTSLFEKYREEAAAIDKGGRQEWMGQSIFCDCLGDIKKLVICGAGHVGIALLRMALMLGFDTTVLEDRPSFADTARRAGAHRVICDSFEAGLEEVTGDEDTYFVVMSRGHRYDLECLGKIVKKSYAYLGMMGSHGRSALVRKKLLEDGVPEKQVAELHAPIGLSIHAETPEEIAVSILSEVISVKNGEQRTCGFSEEQLALLQDPEDRQKKVLCTIIDRHGSAPRSIGTKLLILEDGRLSGTIGGGCMEAGVIEKARWLMQDPDKHQEVIRVRMTADEAEEAGMVCGGIIEVLMERL